MSKLVSIIIPFYKKHEYIYETIDSILNQTYQNFEILIIHDDPLDEKINNILNLKTKDERIKVISNQKNLGAGLSRNKGISQSAGEYIAFLDADDLWSKDKLHVQINFMENNKYDFSHTSYNIINNNKKILSKRSAKKEISFDDLVRSCDIGLSTVIIKKKVLLKCSFPSLQTKEDYVLWLNLSNQGVKIFGLDQHLVFWRKTQNSLSSNLLQKIIDGFRVYYIYMGYNFLKSVYSLIILSFNFLRK